MNKIFKILRSENGQGTVEILVAIGAVAIIAATVMLALNSPVEALHDNAVDGITKITGGGM